MAPPSKSQWDFGDLFSKTPPEPQEPIRQVLSVSELTQQIKRLLEKEVGTVWVDGEISNLRAQASGHVYFTLKDAGAQLSCVMFRANAARRRELLQDGQKVRLQGALSVYEPRGQYQLIVREVEPLGIGALQVAFEKLKQRLGAEGLFAQERKRMLPHLVQCLGVVTSPTGAAIRDVINVARRRHPGLRIILAPCKVQGAGAAEEIARAIFDLNTFQAQGAEPPMDLILVTRGGGSLEDLWAFNEEVVARAIFASDLPVVSAVGHEIDFTISDFVADVRAATPSAAAELITQGMLECRANLEGLLDQLARLGRRGVETVGERFEALEDRLLLCHPRRRLEIHWQRLDDLADSLLHLGRRQARDHSLAWQALAGRLTRLRPSQALAQRAEKLGQWQRLLSENAASQMAALTARYEKLSAQLRLLSPDQTLARGYSITSLAEDGHIVRDAAAVKPGTRLRTRVHKGEIRSTAEE
jgi:exodeoxyribonuclease VII large subunit